MKKIIPVISVVILMVTSFFVPVLSASAGFTVQSTMQSPVESANTWYFVLAESPSNGYLYKLEGSCLADYVEGMGWNINSLVTAFDWKVSKQPDDLTVTLSIYNLVTGELYSSESRQASYWSGSSGRYVTGSFSNINPPVFATHNIYAYPIGSFPYYMAYPDITLSDPFVTWYSPVYSSDVVRSNIPQPLGNVRHLYFADHLYLYEFCLAMMPQYHGEVSPSSSGAADSYSLDISYDYFPYLSISGNSVTASFQLSTIQASYPVIFNKYDVVTGEYIASTTYSLSPSGLDISFTASDLLEYGFYQSGFEIISSSSVGKLKISWSDTIDYTSNLLTINSNLDSVVSKLSSMIVQDSNYYNLVSGFLSYFFNFPASSTNTWASYLTKIDDINTNIINFRSAFVTWYQVYYVPKTDLTNQLLNDILTVLTDGEEITVSQDTSIVDEGVSARDALKVTDGNGQEVDPADQVEVAFSEAADGIGSLGDSVTGINGLIQMMFFKYPLVLLPIIVALALGLLVTILGKNKSD